ncbi:DUF4340 domain-containing protein [Candidatus Falkowbacteria bacterium]|nr:DUF4340 domain-containing protein [Candidatus Falkowbacteria bacterium]
MAKKTLILGILLIALIALAYAYQVPLKKWQNNLGKPKNILADIKIDLADKIEVINQGKTLALVKQNQKWKYNDSKDFYADASVMAKAFAELKIAAESEIELVSNSRERKSEFKTDGSGIEVKIYQADKKNYDFIIGGLSSDYVNSYISTPESAATYAVKADLSGAFNPADWRDFTVFSTAKEKINKIRFQYPNREFTAEFKDGKWSGVLPDKFPVDQKKIQPAIDIMSNLKAAEIPAQTFANTGLDKHLIIIEASGDGVNNVLMVGAASNGLYYAKRGDSDNIYLISKAERDELDKWSRQLK